MTKKLEKFLSKCSDVILLDDIDKQDIFILNLQRAVQAIDLATHIIASEGLGLSDTVNASPLRAVL